MTISTAEGTKTHRATHASTPADSKLIQESITVASGLPDSFTVGSNTDKEGSFHSSMKTARTPPQAKAEPLVPAKSKQEPPNTPRPATRTQKFDPTDLVMQKDGSKVAKASTKQPTMHEPVEMLNYIKGVVSDLPVPHDHEEDKSWILATISEMIVTFKGQCKPSAATAHVCDEETCATNKQRSWAQIASGPKQKATVDIHMEIAKRKRLETLKKECAKTGVAISIRGASEDVQNDIAALKESDMAKTLGDHINNCMKAQGKPDISIKGAWKATKQVIKIQCSNPGDATTIKDLNWEKLLGGANTISPVYGVVIHGAPKYDIDTRKENPRDVKEKIKAADEFNVKHVRPLMRKPRNPNAPTESIVIFTEHAAEANACINNGLRMGHRIFPAERYAPQYQIRQCFRCQGYGHRAETCTRDARCGKCAKNHETNQCSGDQAALACAQCHGTNVAWHNSCPRRQKEMERLEVLRATLPSHFLC